MYYIMQFLTAACPSELVDAFTHNRPLIETERQVIERHREQTCTEIRWRTKTISAIDVRGEDPENQRERLVQEAVTLSTMLTICKRLEAPIRNLPFDVLQSIAINSFEPIPGPTFARFGAVFGQVCSAWRQAVLLSPQLWTTLFLTMGPPASLDNARAIEWLKRAKGRPFTLYVDFNKPSSGWLWDDNNKPLPTVLPEDAALFFKSLSPYLIHLTYLGVRTHDMKLLRSILDMPFVWEGSELQHLDIRNYYSLDFYKDEVDDQNFSLPLFRAHPPISQLTMELLPYLTGGIHPLLDNFVNWAHLTYLRISGTVEMSQYVRILQSSLNLQVASFVLDLDINNIPPPGVLIHSNLRILALILTSRCDRIALHDLLQIIQFPNLQGLDIVRNNMRRYEEDVPPDRPANHYPTVNTLGEFTHLKMLGLHFGHEENFKPLLDRAPNLEFLGINMFHKCADELFQLISHPDTSVGHILRCLQVLIIQYDRLLDSRTEAAIVNTIMSRHRMEDVSLPPEGRSALQGVIVRVVQSRERFGILERSSTKALWDMKSKCEEVKMTVYLQTAVVAREFNLHAMPHVKSFDDLGLKEPSIFD